MNKGTKEQKNNGTKEQRNKETKEQKNKGTKEQRNKGTKEQRNKETKSSSNWVRHNQVSWSSFKGSWTVINGTKININSLETAINVNSNLATVHLGHVIGNFVALKNRIWLLLKGNCSLFLCVSKTAIFFFFFY